MTKSLKRVVQREAAGSPACKLNWLFTTAHVASSTACSTSTLNSAIDAESQWTKMRWDADADTSNADICTVIECCAVWSRGDECPRQTDRQADRQSLHGRRGGNMTTRRRRLQWVHECAAMIVILRRIQAFTCTASSSLTPPPASYFLPCPVTVCSCTGPQSQLNDVTRGWSSRPNDSSSSSSSSSSGSGMCVSLGWVRLLNDRLVWCPAALLLPLLLLLLLLGCAVVTKDARAGGAAVDSSCITWPSSTNFSLVSKYFFSFCCTCYRWISLHLFAR